MKPLGSGRGKAGEGGRRESRMGMHTLQYLGWITTQDLLQSAGSPLSICNNPAGKELWKRIDIGVCITESLCDTPENNTMLLINSTPL